MAANQLTNLNHPDFTSPMIVGQANDPALAAEQIRPSDGYKMTKVVALEACKFVGLKTDGKVYLASAAAGAGQIPCVGINFQEHANGGAVDVVSSSRTLRLGTPVSGALPGEKAYLSDTTPGHVTRVKPSGTGKLVQVVGTFLSTELVKTDIAPNWEVLA